jgi:hypothetical protein
MSTRIFLKISNLGLFRIISIVSLLRWRNENHRSRPMIWLIAQLYCLPILEPPVCAMEVFPIEHGPPAAIGLMRDTAGFVATFFAHRQACSRQ